MTELLEEISQQPAVLSGLRKYYASPGAIPAEDLRNWTRNRPPSVVLTGMGSSLFATYPAQAHLAEHGVRVQVCKTAELVEQNLGILEPESLLVVVSQSGQTPEVVSLLRNLPPKVHVLAVTNVESSPLGKRGRLLLPLMAGGQVAVSTKTYTCSVAVLMYLAFAITGEPQAALSQEIMRAVEAQEELLDRREVLMPPIVEFFDRPPYVALMSRGADLATAQQGALMLKKVARLPAEPISAAQFRHGPMQIIHPSHRYILLARHGKAGEPMPGLASDICQAGGRVLLFTDTPSPQHVNVRLVQVPPLRLGLGTLVDSVYIQLLAHDAALRAGLEPGKLEMPENVAHGE